MLVSCILTRKETALPDTTPTLDSVAMLGSNPCVLPCWQKITPGISTIREMDEVTQILFGLFLPKKTDTFQNKEYVAGSIGKTFLIDGTKIYFSAGMFSISNHELVEVLDIWADIIGHQETDISIGHNVYWQFFTKYSLQNILAKYGVPEKVLIFGEVYSEEWLQDRNALHLRVLYPSKGIFVNYDMPLVKEGNIGIACPNNADFRLWLTLPNPNQPYLELWESAQGYTNFSRTFDTPIEEAIHLTTIDFYNKFKESNDACFETPLDVWKIKP